MDPKYVTLKLSTGENIIGVLHAEDSQTIMLMHPMHIQSETDIEHSKETFYGQPLCPFSEEQTYFLDKKYIVYVKSLSSYLIPFYHSMVKEFGESEIIKNARMRAEHKVSWGGEEISEEEAYERIKKIKQLQSLEDDELDPTIH